MEISLIRHGEAAATWSESADPGLSHLGQQQAEDAAEALQPYVHGDTLLFSSPLQRALETSVPLARLLHTGVIVEDVFREIPSPVPLAERQVWLRQFMQQHWVGQGDELIAWRAAALQRLLALTQPAVIFTHFLLINAVVGELLDRPETLCCWPANGSITRLRHNGTSLELIALGDQIQTTVN